MKRLHPGLYRATLMTGTAHVVIGVVMAVRPSRMPSYLPSSACSVVMLTLGVWILLGAYDMRFYPLWRLGTALSILWCIWVATGLFVGYGTGPEAVTQSLDRPLLWLYLGARSFAPLMEVPINPAMMKHDDS